jgi:hypothetical protein
VSRVEIHGADGRIVIVDHEGDLSYVQARAMEIWEATATEKGTAGPAFGFITEKADQWDHDKQAPVRS